MDLPIEDFLCIYQFYQTQTSNLNLEIIQVLLFESTTFNQVSMRCFSLINVGLATD